MKDDEVELYLQTCLTHGCTPEQAIKHTTIIDTLLYAELLERTAGVYTRKTEAGYYRKNSNFYHTMNKILEGAINGAFD